MTIRDYPFTQFVGVDVSKAKLDFAFDDGKAPQEIKNSEKQIVDQLIGKITDPQQTIVVMEATGGYERFLVDGLAEAALPVVVVNPWQVRRFGEGLAVAYLERQGDPLLIELFENVRG